MPSELHIRDGAAWRKATEMHFRDGSAWRKAQEVFVHDGTAWRKVFSAGAINNPLITVIADAESLYPSGASASVTFNADGVEFATVNGTQTQTEQWFVPTTTGVGAGYWIRAQLAAGTTPAGPNLNQWHQLNVSRTWSMGLAGGLPAQSIYTQLNISIATDSGGTNIVTTGSVSIGATITM